MTTLMPHIANEFRKAFEVIQFRRELSFAVVVVDAGRGVHLWTGSSNMRNSQMHRKVDMINKSDLLVMTPTSTNTNQVKSSFTVLQLQSYSNMTTSGTFSFTHF